MKDLKIISLTLILCIAWSLASLAQGPTPGVWLYDQNENKIDDRIETIASSFPDSLIDMIVDLRHKPEELDIDYFRSFGEISYVMQYLPSLSLHNVGAEMAFTIAQDMDVVMVEWDETVAASIATSVRAIKARSSSVYANSAWSAGFKGKGINIAILDTGVDDGHPSLDDMDDNPSTNDPKFVAGFDATASPRIETNPDDDNTHYWNNYTCVKADIFHGTHVASIALGTGGGTDSIGVAPEAKLIDVKVLNSCARGKSSNIIAGIEWCIKNRNTAWTAQTPDYYGIDVLNLSLGGSASDGQDALSRAVNKAVKMGLVVVCAVGNDGLANHICTPAAADGAIAVGSVNDMGTINRNDDVMSSFSNRGPRHSDGDSDQMDELKPDVTAYGSFIRSASGVDPGQNGSGFHELSGTSMAAPHVAGVCALILQAHPQFLPHDVKNVLHTTAEDKNGVYNSSLSSKYDVDYGWGIVDAYQAVTTTNIPPDLWISRMPRWWASEDIWLDNPPFVGQANRIYARIHNTSGTPANGVTVTFKVGIFGMGQPYWLWQQTTTTSVSGIGTTTASVAWTPTPNMLQKGPGHVCIQVEIVYAQDPNTQNNMAQKNLKVMHSAGAGAFDFRLWNPYDMHKKIFVGLESFELPEGWAAHFEPDNLFEFNYADSADMIAEIFPSRGAVPGDSGLIQLAEFCKGSISPLGGISCLLIAGSSPAKITLPDTFAAYQDTIFIPLMVTTDSSIGLAQFVIDYDSSVARFISARSGEDVPEFSILVQSELGFPPENPELNKNVLVQLNGGGTNFFSGQNREIVQLEFVIIDSTQDNFTPIVFEREANKTFLTTENLFDIVGNDLSIFDGFLRVRQAKWPLTIRDILDLIDPPRPVEGAVVEVSFADEFLRDTTNADGIVDFPEVPDGDILINISKTGDIRGAISGADALLTLRYLAFMEQLDEGQRIAADVNVDSAITGADALAILRYLAFFSTGLAQTGGWHFVGATPQPIPLPYPLHEPTELTFHAYLLGDVNLDWGAEKFHNQSLPKSATKFDIELHQKFGGDQANDEVVVPLFINPCGQDVNTAILTVKYDPACLEFQSASTTSLSEKFMMVANGEEKGVIHIAMAGVSGIKTKGDMLEIIFKVRTSSPFKKTKLVVTQLTINDIRINSNPDLNINLENLGKAPDSFVLTQNYPNPFNSKTIIRYGIPNDVSNPIRVKLRIYNIRGQLVATLVDRMQSAGYYKIQWDGTDDNQQILPSGIYWYCLEAGDIRAIRKIAILK